MTRLAHTLALATLVPALAGLGLSGCSDHDRNYYGTAAATTSGTTAGANSGATSTTGSGSTATNGSGATTTAIGPLHQKALDFEAVMQAQHTPYGQVQDVVFDASGQVIARGGASRCIWTAAYASAQAMRWRTTRDPAALANMERSLWALHGMAEVTGEPGIICRGFDEPRLEPGGYPGHGNYSQFAFFRQRTSRDQYAGWFQGVGFCFDDIQDPALKAALTQDVKEIADLLLAGDLALIGNWNGTRQQFFSLDPSYAYLDRINAQTWATVDDFPFNLITQAVPYDPQIVQALRQAQFPSVRAGEALKALLVFTVAEHVTGDARYTRYKNELAHTRDFAGIIQRTMSLFDDLLNGRNTAVTQQVIQDVFRALGVVMQTYLQATGRNWIIQQLGLLAVNAIGQWFADAAVRLMAWINDPNNQSRRTRVFDDLRLLANVLNLAGQQSTAQKINDFLNGPASLLDKDGLKILAGSMRSYLGVNLNMMPLATLVELESDPQLKAVYRGAMASQWEEVAGEGDPVTNLLHAAYVTPAPNDVSGALDSLQRFPVDLRAVEVDNTGAPGVVVSPWPDRLGRHGNLAVDPFTIDQRAPDIFPWRRNPREIKSGRHRPGGFIAPLGYLYPYWVGRYFGLIRADQ